MNLAIPALAVGDFEPILISPDQSQKVTAFLRALSAHADAPKLLDTANHQNAHDDYWPQAGSWDCAYKPYIVKAGVLQIPVKGMLLHNFPYAAGTYATGYYYIQKALERGLADPDVKGIALVCDSPGGHVAGCFELVDRIYAGRKIKPIQSFAHEHAYSAAYAVASAGNKVTVSRTGGVGSIGVVTMHMSIEKMLADAGIEITFIYAGKHKKDGNPYEALSEDAKARIQARIDETYGVFCGSVARNRGIDESKIRKTEALTFSATEAVDRGLADKVGPLDEAMSEFCASLMGATGDTKMTTEAKTVAQADHDKAVADARTAAVASERARIAGIKGLDVAKARPAAAEQVAMKTTMSVDEAKDFLAGLPEEKPAEAAAPAAPTNSGAPDFKAAMDTSKDGPGAAAPATGQTQADKDTAASARILAAKFGSATPQTAAKH